MRLPGLLLVPAILAACDSRARPTDPVATGLTASLASLLPGEPIRLLPVFARGTGTIEPGIGPVRSGGSYAVGPFDGGRRFTLTVVDGDETWTYALDVPMRYRERVSAPPPSPIARTRHGATELADGRILLVGGASPGPVSWSTAELFDPASGTLVPAGDLSTGRSECEVVALPDGGALAFGGRINLNSFELATRVEEWSPATLSWSVRGNTICSRAEHTATRLADGRVLLAGGYDLAAGEPVASAEVFDPATETFAAVGAMQEPRAFHAAVRLPDGRVLILGGEDPEAGYRRGVEVFDPATGTFARAGDLVEPTSRVRAVRLGSGAVLVAGGQRSALVATDRLQVFDPASGLCRLLDERLPAACTGHSIHLLRDGRVAVFGGDAGLGIPVATRAMFD